MMSRISRTSSALALAIAAVTISQAQAREIAYPNANKRVEWALSSKGLYMEGVVLGAAAISLIMANEEMQKLGRCILATYFQGDSDGGTTGDLYSPETKEKSIALDTLTNFQKRCKESTASSPKRSAGSVQMSDEDLLSLYLGVVDFFGVVQYYAHQDEISKCILDLHYGPSPRDQDFLAAYKSDPQKPPILHAVAILTKQCASHLDLADRAELFNGLDLNAARTFRLAVYDFEVTLEIAREAAEEVKKEKQRELDEILKIHGYTAPDGRKALPTKNPNEFIYADDMSPVPADVVPFLKPPAP